MFRSFPLFRDVFAVWVSTASASLQLLLTQTDFFTIIYCSSKIHPPLRSYPICTSTPQKPKCSSKEPPNVYSPPFAHISRAD
ncbi:hypothetical protein FJTKL_15423 [Diaporthe vaccinii]|uniref:Secreted protein n=1 Tax=Diaporthe vaccinii TaxID=105482 RepID=A0ABR4E502_9PEZI